MTDWLKQRAPEEPNFQYTCDALSRNIPKDFELILIHCLAHAKRKFVEVEAFFPDECQYVIEQLVYVYKVDAKLCSEL